MKKKACSFLFLLCLLFIIPRVAFALEKMTLPLRWDHQFQFAGYYAAKWKGYYKKAGFDVEIKSAITQEGKILSAVKEVSSGNTEFGVGSADILLAKGKGIPLVVLASIFQQGAAEFRESDARFHKTTIIAIAILIAAAFLISIWVVLLRKTVQLKTKLLIQQIAEKERIEENLRESEEVNRITLNSISDLVFICDEVGRFTFVCSNFEENLGYTANEIENFGNVKQLIKKELFDDQKLTDLGELNNLECNIAHKDGRLLDYLVNIKKVNIKGGTSLYVCREITARKAAEEKLKQSELRHRLLFENSGLSIGYYSIDGIILAFNNLAAERIGEQPEELVGHTIQELYSQELASKYLARIKISAKFKEVHKFEDQISLPAGKMWFESIFSPIIDSLGNVIGVQIASNDITPRKDAEERLINSLKEKDTLLQEIHHRVKNNMQVVSSLLSLQSEHVDDKKVKEALSESQSRVFAMSALHEALYESENLAEIDFERYLTTITTSLIQAYKVNPDLIKFNLHSDKVMLDMKTASPVGMAINELVSNALKHAFPDKRTGEIEVSIKQLENRDVLLIVKDDGVGIPESMDWRQTKSLGLRLVTNLVEGQLDGTIDLNRSNGTQFTIRFNLESNPNE